MGEKIIRESFVKKLTNRIEKLKEPDHRFIICSSGTANLINRDIVKDFPVERRPEMLRGLNYQWQAGEITLLGLRGMVKEMILNYSEYSTGERILHDLNFDIRDFFLCKAIIVPDKFISMVSKKVNLRILGTTQCLFLD